MTWTCKKFEELSLDELYDIMQLRSKVFVLEQNCAYLDPDGKDKKAYHLCGWDDQLLVAYARLLAPGISYPEASIGRVVSDPDHRRKGAGKQLMQNAITAAYDIFDPEAIRIGAQLYLLDFYTALGFRQVSEIYLEDGIEHIEMLYSK
ncbi:MAG: family N-acetyltransferase [Ferruginibacter sp.]|nr:family N-acetyltransferase [Ferruginibacter sp.]